jgi:uncharacterized membrane protein YedE/YeeE
VTETPPVRKPLPVIPLFVFAAIDLLLALALLLVGGFTISFLVVGAIGVVLALLGWVGLRSMPEPE